jgi:hypothetical protein
MLWVSLALVLIALAALRYGADSRDGQDRNPFAPPGFTAPDTPSTGYRRAHTPRDDLAALAGTARAVLQRISSRHLRSSPDARPLRPHRRVLAAIAHIRSRGEQCVGPGESRRR